MKNLFNIYYVNMEKAYEISMLIDNRFHSATMSEKDTESNSVDSPDSTPLDNNGNIHTPPIKTENEKMQDIFRIVNTKSTILRAIYDKIMKKEKNLEAAQSGDLIRVKDVSLSIVNLQEVMSIKTLLSGMTMKISGNEDISLDLMSFLRVLFRDSAYILSGELNGESILLKIPMSTHNEMESQYSISDVEIGKVTVLGIYRGKYPYQGIEKKINSIMVLQHANSLKDAYGIEEGTVIPTVSEKDNKDMVHYIDVIAIVQDLILEEE